MSIPAVIQYPTRTPPDVRGRKSRVIPGRWATIQRFTGADAHPFYGDYEMVTNISEGRPALRPPELPGLDGKAEAITDNYFLEVVPKGVVIGMIRGGITSPVGDFGYFPTLTGISWLGVPMVWGSGRVAWGFIDA